MHQCGTCDSTSGPLHGLIIRHQLWIWNGQGVDRESDAVPPRSLASNDWRGQFGNGIPNPQDLTDYSIVPSRISIPKISLPLPDFPFYLFPINFHAPPNFPNHRTNILHIEQLQRSRFTHSIQSPSTFYSRDCLEVNAYDPIPIKLL